MHYTALQVKTSYSILNSLCDIDKLATLAREHGYEALAITDEGNMFGVMEFISACKKNNIKPIIGIELRINEALVLLYAKNMNGYKNLIKLSTIVSASELTIEILKKYCDNLILVMPFLSFNQEIYNLYQDKFIGYTSLQEREKIKEKAVFINNVSYLHKDDYPYLAYANMIRDGKVVGECELDIHKGNHLLTKEEFDSQLFKDDIENIDYIVQNCNLEIGYNEGLLPIYNIDINSKSFLHDLSLKGLKKRLNNNVPKEYIERLNKELKVIDEMGFNDYFLIVYDYVLYAKKKGILVGPGRGSAAGSLVSYTLGITDIDPLKYNLLFERFLNKERVTMPDIDIDFDAARRQEVIDYVINKYGEKKVVGIITFNTMGAKQVIRDVGRVLNLKQSLIDSVAKACLRDLTLEEAYKSNKNLKKLVDNSSDVKKMFQIATHLEGMPRHVSVHAAGVVMSKSDIDETIPLYKNQLGMYVSAYSKDYLEPLGLLKMDFLGIANLTMINEIINNIRKDTSLNITFENIPLDDKKTMELFSRGDTDGIFQFEASGMIKFLQQLRPNKFTDIVVATSLYRPGPMESIPEYLKNRNNPDNIDYFHSDLKDILKETYGIIIYQEQVMQIAVKMAGYTLGEADILRRAMSKKKEDILLKEKKKFVNGSVSKGYSRELAIKVYNLILKFANYGFNKSHAVSYALIAYRMAFLKTHFYQYFMLSLLTGAINNENKTNIYISELRMHNVSVNNPDINLSEINYVIHDKLIIAPLSIIRNVGVTVANQIISEREKGKFSSFSDFVRRTLGRQVNRKVIESLIKAGAFNSFGSNKKTLINNLDNVINYAEVAGVNSLIKVEEPIIDKFTEYSPEELINQELEIYGFYISNHPVSKYKKAGSISTLEIDKYDNKYINIVLEVLSIKEVITKKNDVMGFVKASDEFRQIDVILFPNLYNDNKYLEKHDIIVVNGRVEKRINEYQIVASKVTKL